MVKESVGSLKELKEIHKFPNKNYRLTSDINASETMNSRAFKSIRRFSGILDGNGHKIENIRIEGLKEASALFNNNKGIVKNLTIKNLVIDGTLNVGGIAGVNSGRIENCHVNGKISGKSEVGGIVGHNKGKISSCSFSGKISGMTFVGGIIGNNDLAIKGCCTVNAQFKEDDRDGSIFDLAPRSFGGIVGNSNSKMKIIGSPIVDNCNLVYFGEKNLVAQVF